ncbi:uncharacterized protein LOC117140904 [Drosophila mauritiana]|uniref:Uncharacterized protein LOC117140904 n=1 Tax=Drosophila mauritiana TaxID=7226 RepID=A0A6P8K6I2_DROMA|nr:uncharacterized protein LOC117140904 [Drosophila mauritiana]
MPNYTFPYTSRCISCGVAVSTKGCLFKVSQNEVQDTLNSCGSEDVTSNAPTSKISNPRKRHSQIKRKRNSSHRKLINGFKLSPKKPFTPFVKKQILLMSSEHSLYKAVILREMIRLGRKPNRKFEKAAINAVIQ